MTRQDFSQMLAIASENATVKINDCLPHIFKLSKHKIDVLLTGSESFNMTDCFHFIQACDFTMEFEWEYCKELSDLRAAIKKTRQDYKMSRRDLSIKSGVHTNVISAFEDGSCTLKIDSLLRIADALNATITIE